MTVDPANDFLTGMSRDSTRSRERSTSSASSVVPGVDAPAGRATRSRRSAWIWDCDHYQGKGEKTEFHPFRAVWVARGSRRRSARGASEADLYVSTDATPAGRGGVRAGTKGSDHSSLLALDA